MFLSLLMNIIQFIISIHALHQFKLLDGIRSVLNRDHQTDCDSVLNDQSDSTGPPSLESSQVNLFIISSSINIIFKLLESEKPRR